MMIADLLMNKLFVSIKTNIGDCD